MLLGVLGGRGARVTQAATHKPPYFPYGYRSLDVTTHGGWRRGDFARNTTALRGGGKSMRRISSDTTRSRRDRVVTRWTIVGERSAARLITRSWSYVASGRQRHRERGHTESGLYRPASPRPTWSEKCVEPVRVGLQDLKLLASGGVIEAAIELLPRLSRWEQLIPAARRSDVATSAPVRKYEAQGRAFTQAEASLLEAARKDLGTRFPA